MLASTAAMAVAVAAPSGKGAAGGALANVARHIWEPKMPPRSDLLDELEGVLGSGRRSAVEARVAEIEDAMRPTFTSLPRLRDGRLPSSGARYLLHRFFVERHGWFVEGLRSRGEPWNSSSPAAFFAEHADAETEGIFARRLGARGLSLHEAAVFAATLENLVHEETLERLRGAYGILGLDVDAEAKDASEAEQIIDTYMYMLLAKVSGSKSRAEVYEERERLEMNPEWSRTLAKVHDVRREVADAMPGKRTNFSSNVEILEKVADRHSDWNEVECVALKRDLMKYESGDSGRVLLRDFYGAALTASNFYTAESKEYLRKVGALDEATFSQPSVIIPNYVYSPSNCLASLKFYSVCCINECEALLKSVEQRVSAPDAPPREILEVVEKLPSATVHMPRVLPASLAKHLDDIAAQHSGRIPLHGRLFALWMHHAFPRECPFPHLSGTVKLMTGDEFEQAKEGRHVLTAMELRAEVDAYARMPDFATHSELPWSSEEELIVYLPSLQQEAGGAVAFGGALRRLIRPRGPALVLAAVALSALALKVQRLMRVRSRSALSAMRAPFADEAAEGGDRESRFAAASPPRTHAA